MDIIHCRSDHFWLLNSTMAGRRDGDYRESSDNSDMDIDLDPESTSRLPSKDKGKGRANARVQKLKNQSKEVGCQR